MIEFPLAMRPAPEGVRAARDSARAWFIPGADSSVWLEEMIAWRVPTSRLSLFIVPTSLSDRIPIGVLVALPGGLVPAATRRAQPYAQLGGRLYLPIDAILHPMPSEAELREKLSLEVNVLHPSGGLSGFARDDAIRVSDLLQVPPRREATWNQAVCGVAAPMRLIAVEPDRPPQLLDIVEGGRDDIGSKSPHDAPRGPSEHPIRVVARRAAIVPLAASAAFIELPARLIEMLRGLVPRLNPARSPKNTKSPPARKTSAPAGSRGLRGWLWRKIQSLSKSLDEARLRELKRLAKMLESDPDMGLRYAIQLRDTGSRGSADPSDRLGAREVNFSLVRVMGGSLPGDPWTIPPDIRQSLQQRYREAANRELNLGRHRRAAYIFAELLGDYAAAASALEQGRYFREAAVLYRDRLNNRQKAAECLEHGGLLNEAVDLYKEVSMFEKAGDLCTILERTHDADVFYWAQVEAYRRRPDLLPAARLLEHKLKSLDEALKLLTDAWPASDASGVCLRESFELLGRLARHEEAEARIARLRHETLDSDHATTAAQILADLSGHYPQSSVRVLSADAARVVAGRELSRAGFPNRAAMTRAVARLAPEDRLLARDANRFVRAPRPAPPSQPDRKAAGEPLIIRQFTLPPNLSWRTAVANADGFYALGFVSRHNWTADVFVVRGLWDGRVQGTYVKHDAQFDPHLDCALHPLPGMSRLIALPFVVDIATTLPGNDLFPASIEIGGLPWLAGQDVIGIGFESNTVVWILRTIAHNELALCAHRTDTGFLIASHTVPESMGVPAEGVQIVVRREQVCITWGSAVLRFARTSGFHLESMPTRVRRIAMAPQDEQFHLAAALENGACLLTSDVCTPQLFGEELSEPLLAFTRGGCLVAADSGAGQVYHVNAGRVFRRGDFAASSGLFALTPTNTIREFATFSSDGKVTVYGIPN